MNKHIFNKQYLAQHLRVIETGDYHKRYFELLEQLSPVEHMDKKRFSTILRAREIRGVHTYVLEHEQCIIATISYFVEPKFYRGGRSVVHIEDVIVDYQYRHHKIGNMLLDFIKEKEHVEASHYKLILDCKHSLKKFYELAGFVHSDIVQMSLYTQDT